MTPERKCVLILEDNIPLALEWKKTFELNGADAIITHTAKETLELLKLERFDLVVTDLFIRGVQDGLSILVQLIRMNRRRPPVITVTSAFLPTASDTESNLFIQQAKRLGAAATIQKPFPAGELVALAADIWDQDTRGAMS